MAILAAEDAYAPTIPWKKKIIGKKKIYIYR